MAVIDLGLHRVRRQWIARLVDLIILESAFEGVALDWDEVAAFVLKSALAEPLFEDAA
jgi:tRNA A-37 threonylcarbamoyl transferase component Bud32